MINIEILVGSTLGSTEYVAEATQPYLESAGFTTNMHFTPDLTKLDIETQQIWLICIATHGAGDYPDNFKPYIEQLKQLNTKLNNVHFGLVGIGDSNYDTYCHAAKNLNKLLIETGAKRIGETFYIDVVDSPIPEDKVEEWIPSWIEDLKKLLN